MKYHIAKLMHQYLKENIDISVKNTLAIAYVHCIKINYIELEV